MKLADSVEKNWSTGYREQIVSALRRFAAVEADCAPYLKEGETPAERIKRALGDADSLMSLYRDVVAERDALKAELERIKAQGVAAAPQPAQTSGYGPKIMPQVSGFDTQAQQPAQPVLSEKDALLRQALDALKAYSKSGYVRAQHPIKYAAGNAAAEAIRNHLGVEP